MNNILQIQSLCARDWQDAYDVERTCFGSHAYPDFFFRQAVDAWPDGLIGAFIDGELVGYALCVPGKEPTIGWILSVAVLDSHRGCGVGKALMNQCLSLGFASLKLTVAPDNPARHLYFKLGFQQQAFERDYFGPGEDRLLLVR
ncbi:GNAT family N-acetyltransferase [Shewanella litorisediminis]|uniref:GNAT family N-acetyltransferase n=1 Tax=Shewanella litorisediminis TaxID=1173586 RepID=UPI001EEF96B7|nr:GNAT family N-acetyltransferase [Shewanella litorisediminis]MCL2919360.1 GNAT family N-acetyltransferase [Shewanella litorisediminis]